MDVTLEEVFDAYIDCRKTKRSSLGSLNFEIDFEDNLVMLYNELKNRTWKPGQSTCFIVKKPVYREVFAAPFRDRIVHHLLINRINPYFERYFIHDTYACRVGKGTHAAIKRVEHFVRSESLNGQKKAYVLKLDIKSFFMSINKDILYNRLKVFLLSTYGKDKGDISFELYLIKEIIYNNPCDNCIYRSQKEDWNLLPIEKSLFGAKENLGLPIGNLTSQVFANFYLSSFDHYIKHTLKIKKYVRYVDDFVIVDSDKDKLRLLIKYVRKFLEKDLGLKLQEKKIYLQPTYNGVYFLGCFIKPKYTVCSRRIKNNYVQSLKNWEDILIDHRLLKEEKDSLRASVNSYLGIMSHYKTYNFRGKKLFFYLGKYIKNYFLLDSNIYAIH